MNRKTRFMIALALLAGVLGYRAMQRQAPETDDRSGLSLIHI